MLKIPKGYIQVGTHYYLTRTHSVTTHFPIPSSFVASLNQAKLQGIMPWE